MDKARYGRARGGIVRQRYRWTLSTEEEARAHGWRQTKCGILERHYSDTSDGSVLVYWASSWEEALVYEEDMMEYH